MIEASGVYNAFWFAVRRGMFDIELNPDLKAEIRIVGNERIPVIIIDDPIVSPDALIEYAATRADFSAQGIQGYPGIRANLPPEYAETLLPRLRELIADVYKPPPSFEFQLVHQLFSLVSYRPEQLHFMQRVPHFDNHSPYYFATVHYLNPEPHAGTGIFRHRPTGFERLPEERYPFFVRAAEAYVQSHGMPAEKYIDGSDDHFEMIAELEYRPNRLVMYPGNVLHSGLIEPERDISDDPRSGRLTANLFLYFADQS